MSRVQHHLRQTILAGIFAAVPIGVTAFIIWFVNSKIHQIADFFLHGRNVPFVGVLGVLVAVAVIYLCGLVATTLLGKFFLRVIDGILSRVPLLRPLYVAWKQVLVTPGGTEGVFSKVVLIPDETNATLLLGFSSGRCLEDDPQTLCVFVPAAPNPINGRLYFVQKEKCQFVDVSPEEAFKVVLSTGNYVPKAIGTATKRLMSPVTPAQRPERALAPEG